MPTRSRRSCPAVSAVFSAHPRMSPGTSSAANPLSASLLLTESNPKPLGPDPLSFTLTLVEMLASLWFGGHRVLGVAVAEQVGAVLSTLIVTLCEAVPPALVAEQVKVTPVVSVVTLCVLQPRSWR